MRDLATVNRKICHLEEAVKESERLVALYETKARNSLDSESDFYIFTNAAEEHKKSIAFSRRMIRALKWASGQSDGL